MFNLIYEDDSTVYIQQVDSFRISKSAHIITCINEASHINYMFSVTNEHQYVEQILEKGIADMRLAKKL